MVQTRRQQAAAGSDESPVNASTSTSTSTSKKSQSQVDHPPSAPKNAKVPAQEIPKKREHDDDGKRKPEENPSNGNGASSPPAKSAKREDANGKEDEGKTDKGEPQTSPPNDEKTDPAKIAAVLSAEGILPLSDVPDAKPSIDVASDKPSAATILALLYHAMLTSARISHNLAYSSTKALVAAGYHDIETLKQSSWEDRTKLLTESGYTRYREKTATGLGELADFISKEYDGDLNNLLKRADSNSDKVRTLLKEIKGLGEVGVNIFQDTAQGVWPCLTPFIDPRSLETAKQIGLGEDVTEMFKAVGNDPVKMGRLSAALTKLRLEKKEDEFVDEE
ncbi:MAG: hypothetical protein M4579_003475 [Chaenotheca gracillima]|nr:MAG: hypothetical protein M4579_003475 [Chaenotheca gracillima]